jgi:hypothetical protein
LTLNLSQKNDTKTAKCRKKTTAHQQIAEIASNSKEKKLARF